MIFSPITTEALVLSFAERFDFKIELRGELKLL